MDLSAFLKKKKYYSIPLKKTKTRHFELKVYINGIKGTFILDTGASNTCIGLHKSEYFELLPQDSETKAAGAGSTSIETQTAKDVKLKIGKWEVNDWHMVLIDLSHVNQALAQHGAKEVEGIIGADILEKGKAIIDYEKKKLYLKKSKPFKKGLNLKSAFP